MTASAPTERVEEFADGDRIIRPGRNCWREEPAERAAVLVDAAAYYHAFAEAASRARHSIFVLGWDFNSAVRLHPGADGLGECDQVGRFLDDLLRRNRRLHVYVLDWDFSVLYALQRELLPRLRIGRGTHRRFHFRLDNRHPIGGAQHQKVVVIDDAMAFVGGCDFGACRWDTPAHAPEDWRRIDPWGKAYGPYHDVQIAVDGAAAAALGALARARWQRATGERPIPAKRARHADPWPPTLEPDFRGVDVAIARTMPALGDEPEAREVESLYLDAIAAARYSLYVENQYLTSASIGAALAARLREPTGPEIVIVLPRQCEGWLEETTMGVLRARLLRELEQADRYRRLRVYYPDVAGLNERRLTVHAKLLIADDRLLRIGSANLNNRSMGLDSECDVAIDAGGDSDLRAAIVRVRDRLLGERLGQPPARVAATMRQRGSLVQTIEALSGPARGLRRLDPTVADWIDQLVPDAALVDPERPVDADTLLALLAPGPIELRRGAPWLWTAAALLSACAVASLVLWL